MARGTWQAAVVSSNPLLPPDCNSDRKPWGKKTYNNAISILRRAFEFGYRNHPEQHDPARSLRNARLKKKDRPKIDPFSMHDAETFIAAIHRDWGEALGNYGEFRFFTGLRPSEHIALVLSDLDLVNGMISINKARVAGVERCQTKTGEDRRIALCPRASAVLKRQLPLRARLRAEGLVRHDCVFFREDGEPSKNLQIQGKRWRKTLTPRIPPKTPSCHWSCHWKSLSRTGSGQQNRAFLGLNWPAQSCHY